MTTQREPRLLTSETVAQPIDLSITAKPALANIGVGPGPTISTLLQSFQADSMVAASRALLEIQRGVARGENPLLIAPRVRRALQSSKARAERIARTEVMRTYRNTMLDKFQVNPLVNGWTWVSARGSKTCAFCWAMHGRQFTLRSAFGSHPNCRCSVAPVNRVRAQTLPEGPTQFARLSAAAQQRVLGKAKYEAYKDGLITLDDLIVQGVNSEWGPFGYEGSLASALTKARARY